MKKNRYYYKLKDSFKTPDVKDTGIVVNDSFKHWLEESFLSTELDTVLKSNEANILFCKYIWPRYKECVIDYSEGFDEEFDYKQFKINYCSILNRTYIKYKSLIDVWDSVKADLNNKIKSVNKVRFNDTPQNGGDFTNDTYSTNYTESLAEIDNNNVAKLFEIENTIDDYYKKWADEFKEIFWYE